MKSVVTTGALFGVALVVFLGCDSSNAVTPSSPEPTETENSEDCDGKKSRGPSESCCPSFGVDACGAELFCAAFDGRTQATCYVLGSRKSLEECTEDEQCLTKVCAKSGKCVSLLGEACKADVGCSQATGTQGSPTACVDDKCATVKLQQCAGDDCASEENDICAVPSASIALDCPKGLQCSREAGSELSRCKNGGVTGKAPLYGECEEDEDCGDGTYDGVCVQGADYQVCGYKECTGDGDCSAGKNCLTCPLSNGSIQACVSPDHVGNKGAKCK